MHRAQSQARVEACREPSPDGVVGSDILAVVTTTAPWSAAAEVAVALAARTGGELTGCRIDPEWRELDAAESMSIPVLGSGAWDDGAQQRDDCAFTEFARERGVEDAAWCTAQAGIAQTLRQLGAWHDLAVLERDMVTPERVPDVLGEAMLGCGVPCLLLPDGRRLPSWPFARVVIGWNGSMEAIRALHAARGLLMAADAVHVLDGAVVEDEVGRGLPRFDPCRYLARHGITASRSRVSTDVGSAGEVLLDASVRLHADLLVMGAYGRSHLRERVVGGASRYVLEHAEIPLLMRH
ncbi:universal stress protein [Oleiagrimonas sp. MCCC 1A03011]|jgi:nucleotide-binding universal stress UspA family protein|uniref:universal stress protein n=1 Tax=Oleiagrimonas sp. MCCC 1A03011 TaxID=1926883 RepID=UPI000DD9631B|nr:universal stress protein [Oleiagrimonas sp. MCCC 1A03011]